MPAKDRRYRKTEVAIKEAAIALINEVSRPTIELIPVLERADINKSTFYLHYRNTRDLVESLQDDFLSAIFNARNAKMNEMETKVGMLVDFVAKNRQFANAAFVTRDERFYRRFRLAFLSDAVRAGKKKSQIESLGESGFCGYVIEVLSAWCASRSKLKNNEIVDLIMSAL